MKIVVFFVCVTYHAVALGGPGMWDPDFDGGGSGPIPTVAVATGLIVMVWAFRKFGCTVDSLGDLVALILGAWYWFCLGAILGMPISCILK